MSRAEPCAGAAADHDRLDLRQVAFEILRILVEENLADDRAENRVAQKLQPLVGAQSVHGPGGMRQRGLQQALVLEDVADSLLTSIDRVVVLGGRQRREIRSTSAGVSMATCGPKAVRDANDVAVGNPDKSELPTEFSNRLLANVSYLTLAAFSVFVNSVNLANWGRRDSTPGPTGTSCRRLWIRGVAARLRGRGPQRI